MIVYVPGSGGLWPLVAAAAATVAALAQRRADPLADVRNRYAVRSSGACGIRYARAGGGRNGGMADRSAVINLPEWDGLAREMGEVWTLRKGSRVASCHPLDASHPR